MDTGVRTPNLPLTSTADEVLVNRDGSTYRQTADALNSQMAGSGAIGAALADVRTDVEDGLDALGNQLITATNGFSSRMDGIDANVTALETTVGQIQTGSAEGIIGENTLADLTARAVALGFSTANAGRMGRVYADTVSSRNGDYRWSGSAWSYLGLDRIGKEEATSASLVKRTAALTCNGEIIIDRKGLLGGGAAIYVPTLLALVTATATVINKTLTADAKMSSWCKVAIADNTNRQIVYFDLGDTVTPIKVASAMPTDVVRYWHLVTLFGTAQGWTSEHRVVSTEEWQATFVHTRPVVYDASIGRLYIPTLSGMRSGSLYWSLSPLATTDALREIDVPTSGSATFIWIDVMQCMADARSAAAVIVSQGYSNRPVRASSALILLGVAFGKYFSPAHPDLRVANIVGNQCGAGRDDNDRSDLVFPGSVPTALVRSESISLGFTRGYYAPSSYRPYYGGYFPEARSAGVLFYRFYVETDVAGDFATPRGYLHKRADDGTISYTFWNATLEKTVSSNLSIYSGYVSLIGATFVGFWAGVDGATHAGIRVFGVQYYAGPEQDSWISVGDYPRSRDEIGMRLRRLEAGGGSVETLDPVIPPHLFIHQDRPYALYPDQIFGAESHGCYRLTVQSAGGNYKAPATYELASGTLQLRADQLGSSLDWHVQNVGSKETKFSASTIIKKFTATAVASLTPKILFLGDSITEWDGTAVQTVRRLQDMGATVTTIGTMTQSSLISGDGTVLGEGRSGRRMADFYGLTQERMAIVAAGSEASYLALDTVGKRGMNPFLKVAAGADLTTRADMIMSGNIFDLRYYLTRFSLADPNVVVINLATNDYANETPIVAAQHVATGLSILVRQTRSALPTAKILLAYNARGYGAASQAFWEAGFRTCLAEYLKYVLTSGDAGVYLVPGYLAINRLSGFSYTLAADANTGLSSGNIDDATHYAAPGLREFGELLAQFIAGALIG